MEDPVGPACPGQLSITGSEILSETQELDMPRQREMMMTLRGLFEYNST